MARRVNTGFVVTLGAVLCVVAVGALYLLAKNFRRQDPMALKSQAEAARARGDSKQAAGLYLQAAQAAAGAHRADADEFYDTAGELFMEASQKAASKDEAMLFYLTGRDAWGQALTVNPTNAKVNAEVIEVDHQALGLSLPQWDPAKLEASLTQMLKYQTTPSAKLYQYRAEARMSMAQRLNLPDLPEEKVTAIVADASKAVELADAAVAAVPATASESDKAAAVKAQGEAAAMKGRAMWFAVGVAQIRGLRGSELDKRRKEAMDYTEGFLAKHANNVDCTGVLVAEVEGLAREADGNRQRAEDDAARYPTQATELKKKAADYGQQAEELNKRVRDLVENAYRANSLGKDKEKDKALVGLAFNVLADSDPDFVMSAMKAYLAAYPKDAEARFMVGRLEQDQGGPNNTPEVETAHARAALEAFSEALGYTRTAEGIDAFRNDQIEVLALYYTASTALDLASREGLGSSAGMADMKAASQAIESLRNAHRGTPLLDLLDGQTELLKGDIPQAIASLHHAETALNGGAGVEWGKAMIRTKLSLARANQRLTPPQYGEALRYLDEVVSVTSAPNNDGLILERASVQISNGDYGKAMAATEVLMRRGRSGSSGMPKAILERANNLYALAARLSGRSISAGDVQSTAAIVQVAYADLLSGDVGATASDEDAQKLRAERALKDLESIAPGEQDNVAALQVAALAYMQLGQKDKALEKVNQGLAKAPQERYLQLMKLQIANPDAKAMDLVRQVIEGTPDEYTKQIMLAQWYLQARQMDAWLGALQAADKAVNPDAPDGRNKQSDLTERLFAAATSLGAQAKDDAARKKYFDLAQTYVDRAERLNLDGVSGRLYKARMTLIQTNGESGLGDVEKVVSERPDYAPARTLLGKVYYQKDRLDDALVQFRQAIRLRPDDLEATRYAVSILMRNGDVASRSEAKTLLEQGLRYAPRDPTLASYNDSLGDPAKAISAREKMLALDPTNLDNLARLLQLYVSNNMAEKALATMQPVYEQRKSDLNVAEMMARAYVANKRPADGLKVFDAFIAGSDKPAQLAALLRKGALAAGAGDVGTAESAFKAAMAIEPAEASEADRRLGDLYFDGGQYGKAEGVYQAVIGRTKSEARNMVVRRLVETELRLGKNDQALELLDTEILKQQPDDAQGLVLHATARLAQHRADDAMADLNRVLRAQPNYADALYYRALTQVLTQGDIRQAIGDLLRAQEGDKANINTRMLLAKAYRTAHRFGEAADVYADLIAMRPDVLEIQQEYVSFLLELEQLVQAGAGKTDDMTLAIRQARPEERLISFYKGLESTELPAGVVALPAYTPKIQAHLIYAKMLAIRGNVRDAQNEYKMLYEKVPDSLVVAGPYVDSLLATRDYEEAVSVVTEFLKRRAAPSAAAGPGSSAPAEEDVSGFYAKRATALAALKRPADAVKDIEALLAAREKSHDAFFAAAVEAGGILPDGTIGLLKARYGTDHKDEMSGVALAYLLLQAKHPREAMDVVSGLAVPADDKPLLAQVLKISATVRVQAKQYDVAARNYTDLLALTPNDIDVLNSLAYILADNLNRAKEALPYADKAMQMLRSSPSPTVAYLSRANVLDTSGWVKFRAGDAAGSIADLKASVDAQPQAVVYLHLAQACGKAGQMREAADALDKASQLNSAAPDADLTKQIEALKKAMGL